VDYLNADSLRPAKDQDGLQAALTTLVCSSPHRRGVAPVGALGTPLRVYWDIAETLLLERDRQLGARRIAAHLVDITNAYRETIDLAMGNTRLWFNGAAPVDVVDLDVLVVALSAINRFGLDTVRRSMADATESMRPVARVCVDLAFDLAERERRDFRQD